MVGIGGITVSKLKHLRVELKGSEVGVDLSAEVVAILLRAIADDIEQGIRCAQITWSENAAVIGLWQFEEAEEPKEEKFDA